MRFLLCLLLAFIAHDVSARTGDSTLALHHFPPHRAQRSRNAKEATNSSTLIQEATNSPTPFQVATNSPTPFQEATNSPTPFLRITNGNIHHAVKEWMNNRNETMATYGHIKHWQTAAVTDMSLLFSSDRSPSLAHFNEDITLWNVSNVRNLSHAFFGNVAMNLDFSNWNVSRVEDMSGCFAQTKHFVGHGIHNWDVRSVRNATRMFYMAHSFKAQPLWHWNSHKLVDMTEMFAHAANFSGDLSGMDVSSVINMKGAFFKAGAFNGDLSSWKMHRVQDMNSMFAYATSFQGKGLSRWNTTSVSNMANMLKRTAFDQDLNQWNVESVTDMRSMFRYATTFSQTLCWTLHKKNHVNVAGIFFQSAGHFDRSCVQHQFVVESCCRPDLDNACECTAAILNEDHEVAPVENNVADTSATLGGMGAATSMSSSGGGKTHFFTAFGLATIAVSLALLAVVIRRLGLCNSLTTTTIEYGEEDDDLDLNGLDDHPSIDKATLSMTTTDTSTDEDHGPMEDINVQEIV